MTRLAMGLLLLCVTAGAEAAVYRCEQNGKLVFSDKACPNAKRQVGQHGDRWADVEQAPRPDARDATPSRATPEVVEFSGGVENQISQAAARIAVIKIQARDCDWGLKVEKDFLKCLPLLAETVTDGPYIQSLNRLKSLMESHPDLAHNQRVSNLIDKALRDSNDIRDARNLATAWAHSHN